MLSTLCIVREEVHQRAKEAEISSRCVRLRLLLSQGTFLPFGAPFLSFVSTCLQCHLLCRCSVFTFLVVASVDVCCRSRLCTNLSRSLSLASAFVLQLDGLLSSFLCPIIFLWLQLASAVSQGCVRTFLCSLSSASAFVSQLDCHLLPFLCQLIFLY